MAQSFRHGRVDHSWQKNNKDIVHAWDYNSNATYLCVCLSFYLYICMYVCMCVHIDGGIWENICQWCLLIVYIYT
jgi:hypothetical protein